MDATDSKYAAFANRAIERLIKDETAEVVENFDSRKSSFCQV